MKKGITLTVLAATVVIMFILIGVSSAVGISSIKTAAYEEFMSKVKRVSDYVNEYYLENEELPIGTEIVSKEGLEDSLKAEINTNNDSNNNLYVVDMSKINVESVNIGKGTVSDLDVFLVAENSHNVYYLKGITYKGETYHGVELIKKIVWEQNRFEVTKKDITLEVGDLIQYNAGVNGYTGKWKVLGAKDGNLLIMSTENVGSLALYGKNGGTKDEITYEYGLLNGITRINEICSLYGDGTGAINARCIKVEDVDILTEYDKTTYGVSDLNQYGNEVTYSWNTTTNGKVDYTSTNGQNGTLVHGHSSFGYIDFNSMNFKSVIINDIKLPKLVTTAYTYSIYGITSFTTQIKAKEMIFGTENDVSSYWLDSCFTNMDIYSVSFGLQGINKNSVGCYSLYYSTGYEAKNEFGIRAVVELSPDIKMGTKDNSLGWSYTI